MSCEQMQEMMPDVAAGKASASPELASHLKGCAECERTLEAMRETMALLDEWTAPEPSPYFDTRLQARLREERAKPVSVWASWFGWFRRPAFGVAAVALLAVGAAFVSGDNSHIFAPRQTPQAHVSKGTPVGDLNELDKQSDLLQDFDALDSDSDDNTTQNN